MKPRLTFIILVGFYFSVLLVSYLLVFFYPFFTPYGWFVIPVVANFFVGYLVREVDTAIKIIVACFFLHAGIVIGLLNIPLVYDAFISWFSLVLGVSPVGKWLISKYDPFGWMVILIPGYLMTHIILGIAVSSVAITVRDRSSSIISVSVCLVKKMKQIIETLLRKVIR